MKDLYKQGKREKTKNKRFIEAKQKRERERESYETRNERCIEAKQKKREKERAL